MPTPPIPQPRYINSDIALTGLLQAVNVYTGIPPTPSGSISLDDINQQIARAESQVEMDLQTWFQTPFMTNTVPATDWTNLENLYPQTYANLFDMFVIQSQYRIYRQYFGITGENKGDAFWESQRSNYNDYAQRFYKKDQTENYLYQSGLGLVLNPIGMKRVLGRSTVGILGGFSTDNAAYAIRNMTRPYLGWDNGIGYPGRNN